MISGREPFKACQSKSDNELKSLALHSLCNMQKVKLPLAYFQAAVVLEKGDLSLIVTISKILKHAVQPSLQ